MSQGQIRVARVAIVQLSAPQQMMRLLSCHERFYCALYIALYRRLIRISYSLLFRDKDKTGYFPQKPCCLVIKVQRFSTCLLTNT